MKHILIVTHEMIPLAWSWGGCQRMFYLSEELVENGNEVTVIVPYKSITPLFDKKKNFKTIYLHKGKNISWAEHATITVGNSQGENAKAERMTGKGVLKKYLLKSSVFRRSDRWLFNEPLPFKGMKANLWVMQNWKMICQYIDENQVTQMIVSAPDFGLFSLVPKIKKKTPHVEIIMDYRDPWHLWNKSRGFAYLTEKKCLKNADAAVGFSKPFTKDMCEIFGERPRWHTIYNGYSEKAWKSIEEKNADMILMESDKICITYTGTIDMPGNKEGFRNPLNLFNLLTDEKYQQKIEVKIIGMNQITEEMMEWEEKTNSSICFLPKVTQEISFTYMLESDILLVIHDTKDFSGKYLVSAKMYDYMRSGKAIWHIGAKDSIMCEFIEQYDLGYSCLNKREDIKSFLDFLIDNLEKIKVFRRTCKEIKEFSREEQNKRYLSIIG